MKKLVLGFLLCAATSAYATPTKIVDDSDKEESVKIANICKNWFENKQFVSLENFLKQHDNETSKEKNGLSTSTRCVFNMNDSVSLNEWQRQVPNSIYPTLIANMGTVGRFFSIRGGGYINSIPPERLQLAFAVLEDGAQSLDKAKHLGVSPFWYQIRLDIAFLQQDRSIFFNYLNESLTKYPNYMPLYSGAGAHMLPEWGFSYKDLDNFARMGMKHSKLKEEVYTSVYKSVITPCCSNKIIAAGHFDKNTFRKGMYSILKKYPTQYNYNRYAQYSCLLGDRESTKDLIENKMHTYVKSGWEYGVYEQCLKFIQ